MVASCKMNQTYLWLTAGPIIRPDLNLDTIVPENGRPLLENAEMHMPDECEGD